MSLLHKHGSPFFSPCPLSGIPLNRLGLESPQPAAFVIPAKAGIQFSCLDSRLRVNDDRDTLLLKAGNLINYRLWLKTGD